MYGDLEPLEGSATHFIILLDIYQNSLNSVFGAVLDPLLRALAEAEAGRKSQVTSRVAGSLRAISPLYIQY